MFPAFVRLRQIDRHEFKASLGYMSSRSAWVTQQDLVTKNKRKKDIFSHNHLAII